MDITDLKELSAESYDQTIDKIKNASAKPLYDPLMAITQMDVRQHAVMNPGLRKDKTKVIEDEDGKTKTEIVRVARLPIPLQKLIVRRAAAFLCGNPIQLDAQPTDDSQTEFVNLLNKVWDDNKLDYKSMELAKMMMGETKCAELWYLQDTDSSFWDNTVNKSKTKKLRVRILAPSKGDDLLPVFDGTGDMIAFGRGYKVKVGDEEEQHFDIYTVDRFYLGKKVNEVWEVKTETNTVKKIPVMYYSQPYPEWYDVEENIKRLETVNSNAGDTNDYFASPMVAASGEVEGFADKDDQGKVLQLKEGAEVKYLTWDQAPEATKMEIENLERYIYDMTDTPNISFREMKGLGTFSGIALKMLFMGAHLKASEKEGIFGEVIQRRINYLKSALATINTTLSPQVSMSIKPRFDYYLPKNDLETIQMLTEAIGPGRAVMSQENAIRQNPLVSDATAEIEQMKEEGTFGEELQTA